MATKRELTRVWEWCGNISEELAALQDELARLADEAEGEGELEGGGGSDEIRYQRFYS
jgi:hypothetical protein